MLRFLLLILIIIGLLLGFTWLSAQSIPSWYKDSEQVQVNKLNQGFDNEGVANFLGNKVADVLRGEVVLNESEFNALLSSSLQASKDGRRLLAVSDAVHADLKNNKIEFGAIVNLNKLAKQEPDAKPYIDKVMSFLPLGDKERIHISVTGTPIARNGKIAFTDDVSLKLGSIPISNGMLRQLGVPVEKVSQEEFDLKYLRIKSINTTSDEIRLGARPRF